MRLITGAAGYLGGRLLRRLAESSPMPIRCVVRPGTDPAVKSQLEELAGSTRMEMIPVGFNDRPGLAKAMDGVEVVVHAAASKDGTAAAMTANTVVGSDHLFRAAVDARVSRFVLVGSLGVMGTAKLRRGAVVDEHVPMEPHPELRDPYTFSKCLQERLAWEHAERADLPLVVVRPGVIIGPGTGVLGPRIGLQVFGLFLHLGGGNTLPFTHVDNCAEAIALAAQIEGAEKEDFCVVDDDLPTSRQVLRQYRRSVRRVASIRIPYGLLGVLSRLNEVYNKASRGHLPVVVGRYEMSAIWRPFRFSNEKAKAMLGWQPEVPMREALAQTLEFHT